MRSTWGSVIVTVVAFAACLGLALGGCGGGENGVAAQARPGLAQSLVGQTTEAIANVDTIVCDVSSPYTTDDGVPAVSTEWYSLTALNSFLKYSPEFSAFAGIGEVRDCNQARAVSGAAEAYEADHPGFRLDLPSDRSPRPVPPEPPPTPPTTAKLLSASFNSLGPVVKLTNSSGTCTGSFIAKNWILTAAHCLALIQTISLGSMGFEVDAGPNGYTNYLITFFSSTNGRPNAFLPADGSVSLKVLQYAHPQYVGYQPLKSIFHAYDVALLYVPRQNDGDLQPGPTTSVGSAWMRISLSSQPTSDSNVWGAGINDKGQPDLLQFTSFGQAFPFFTTDTRVGGQATSGGPFICAGDSGGPVVDFVTNPDDNTEVPVVVDVVCASSDGCGPKTTDHDSGACNCAGGVFSVTRLDLVTQFIQDSLKDWNGSGFSCRSVSSGSDRFLQCWGQPCNSAMPCPTGQACSRPGETLGSSCSSCGNNNGCGCILGQCLPM